MRSKTLAEWRKHLRIFLRILGMSSLPHTELEEFPCGVTVTDWEHSMFTIYTSQDLLTSRGWRSRRTSLRVTAIRHYKRQTNVQHEYIVAEVLDTIHHKYRYLRVDCTGEDPLPNTEKGSIHTLSTSSSQASLAISKQFLACDHVKTIESWPNDILISDIDVSTFPITILDLAMVAKIVHDSGDMYQVSQHNCFWYSDAIIAVLQHHFKFPASNLRDTQLCGTFKKFPIYTRKYEGFEAIFEKFEAYKDHTDTLISEAAQAVDELAHMLEEVQRQRDEAQKKIGVPKSQGLEADGI